MPGHSFFGLIVLGKGDLESLLASRGVKDHRVVRVLLDVAIINHLAQELRGYLALMGFIFELAKASPERNQLPLVGHRPLYLQPLLFLVLLDLLLGPAPLAARLHEVCGDALRH